MFKFYCPSSGNVAEVWMDGGILCNVQVREKMEVGVDGPLVAGLEAPVDVAGWAPKSWIFIFGWMVVFVSFV